MNRDKEDLLNCTGFVDSNFQEIVAGDTLLADGIEWLVEDTGTRYIATNDEGDEVSLKVLLRVFVNDIFIKYGG